MFNEYGENVISNESLVCWDEQRIGFNKTGTLNTCCNTFPSFGKPKKLDIIMYGYNYMDGLEFDKRQNFRFSIENIGT